MMKITWFKDTFDNEVTPELQEDLPWSELVEFFSEHPVFKDKQGCIGFTMCKFKDVTDPTVLPANVRRDAGQFDTPNRPTIPGSIGRLSKNVTHISALLLDADARGWTVEQAKEDLAPFTYLGYTSWSHLQPGKGERFRIILPFKDDCTREEWVQRFSQKSILEVFPLVDACCVDIARIFYTPGRAATHTTQHQAWNNTGEFLDWRDFPIIPAPPAPTPMPLNLTDEGTGNIVWQSFNMLQFFKDQGLYIGADGGGKHRVCCPNYQSHSGAAKGGTIMYEMADTWDRFSCSHDSCREFSFWDHYKEALGSGWMAGWCKREKEESPAAAITRIINSKKG